MNLCLRYENVEYALKIETDRAELFLALTIEFWIDFNLTAFLFELQCRFIYGLRKNWVKWLDELFSIILLWGIFFLIEEQLNIAVTSLTSFCKP